MKRTEGGRKRKERGVVLLRVVIANGDGTVCGYRRLRILVDAGFKRTNGKVETSGGGALAAIVFLYAIRRCVFVS